MTTNNSTPVSAERIELPNGWYFNAHNGLPILINPQGRVMPSTDYWNMKDAQAFAAAMQPAPRQIQDTETSGGVTREVAAALQGEGMGESAAQNEIVRSLEYYPAQLRKIAFDKTPVRDLCEAEAGFKWALSQLATHPQPSSSADERVHKSPENIHVGDDMYKNPLNLYTSPANADAMECAVWREAYEAKCAYVECQIGTGQIAATTMRLRAAEAAVAALASQGDGNGGRDNG